MVPRSLLDCRGPGLACLAWLSGGLLAACGDSVNDSAGEPALAVAATISWDPKS
jgi:hypothetical protein